MPGFYDEIGEQPDALRRTLDGLKTQVAALTEWRMRLTMGGLKRVIFSGMGASHAANLPAQLMLLNGGIEAFVIDSSELLHYQLPLVTPETMLVLISQSGRSVETVRLIDVLNERAPILAITNNAEGPLAHHADTVLLMQAGAEATVSSKTYTCTLATQHLLATALTGGDVEAALRDLYAAADAMERALPLYRERAAEIVARFDGAQTIMYLGRGASMASALCGALITKESSKYPTEGMQAAQYRHGPYEMTDERIAAFIYLGDDKARPLQTALAQDMIALGARVAVVGKGADVSGAINIALPDVPDALLPLLEITPIHHFAAAFSAHRGFTPGEFRYITKVTTKE
jgi:glucosamine--fructose-6-phosphate aminotransferase (isomerizing)